jgi:hypothetical protein
VPQHVRDGLPRSHCADHRVSPPKRGAIDTDMTDHRNTELSIAVGSTSAMTDGTFRFASGS